MGAETRAQNRQNAWQYEQNEFDREFQREMVDVSAEKDYEIWKRQFEQQNAQWYEQSDYTAQLQQQQERAKYQILREQGVNPAVAIANGANSGMPSVPVQSISSPAGGRVNTGTPSGHSPTSVDTDVASLASIVQSVLSASSLGIDATKTFTLLNAELKNKLEESRYRSVMADYQSMANAVYSEFGKNEKALNMLHTYAATMLAFAKGDTEVSQKALNQVKKEYTDVLKQIDEKRLPYVVPMLVKSMHNLDSMSALNAAKSSEAYSAANLNTARAITENDLRQYRVDTEHWNSLLAHNEYVFKDATQMQRFEQYIEETKQAGIISGQMEQSLRLATKNNDWYTVRMLLGMVDSGVKAYGAVKGAKTGQGFVDAQDVRNDIDRQYKEYLQKEDDIPAYLKRDVPNSFGYR